MSDEIGQHGSARRLQKVLARAGLASRRDCEKLIAEGRVTINGHLAGDPPIFVDPETDRIEVDGQPIRIGGKGWQGPDRRSADRGLVYRPTYIALHKPRRVVSTVEDEPQFRGKRKTVIDLIDAGVAQRVRLFPVGRLDADSTGLLLLTDDGDLAHRLTHPSFGIRKRYEVTVRGRLSEDELARLRDGLILARRDGDDAGHGESADPGGKRAKPDSVVVLGTHTDRDRGDTTVLGITLTEGQNREIRRLLARLGFKVRRLKRNAIGPLKLKGLASGEWRHLTPTELGMLRKAVGLGGKGPRRERER